MSASDILDRIRKGTALRQALENYVPEENALRIAREPVAGHALDLKDMNRMSAAVVVQNFVPDGRWSHQDLTVFFSDENDLVRFRLLL
jgi:hypothetical protein